MVASELGEERLTPQPTDKPVGIFRAIGIAHRTTWRRPQFYVLVVGAITGIVGACGGLGGFFPPLVMGATYNEAAHSYTIGLVLLTITAAGALLFTLFGMRRKAPATA